MLQDEANAATEQQQLQEEGGVGREGGKGSGKLFVPRDALMARANSLKKAVRNVLDMTEKEIDTQVEVTAEVHSLMQPVSEEPAVQASPNVSPYSSLSSIDSGRRDIDMGPPSFDTEPRSSFDSGHQCSIDSGHTKFAIGPRSSIDSFGGRGMELGLRDSTPRTSVTTAPHFHGRPSLTLHGSVVEPAP